MGRSVRQRTSACRTMATCVAVALMLVLLPASPIHAAHAQKHTQKSPGAQASVEGPSGSTSSSTISIPPGSTASPSATAPAVTNGQGDSLTVSTPTQEDYAGSTEYCGFGTSPRLFGGASFAPCGYVAVYDATSATHTVPSVNSTSDSIYDACNSLVTSGSLGPWYPTGGGGFSGGYLGGIQVFIPWNESPTCFGQWTETYSAFQYFADGSNLTASATATFTVYPDAPTWIEVAAQCFGGCPIHSPQADPVDSFSGSFNYAPPAPDATLAALGGPLVMSRSYTSNDPTTGPLGKGWSSISSEALAGAEVIQPATEGAALFVGEDLLSGITDVLVLLAL